MKGGAGLPHGGAITVGPLGIPPGGMCLPRCTVEEHGTAQGGPAYGGSWVTTSTVLCPPSPPLHESPHLGGEGRGLQAVSTGELFLPLSTYLSFGGPLRAREEGRWRELAAALGEPAAPLLDHSKKPPPTDHGPASSSRWKQVRSPRPLTVQSQAMKQPCAWYHGRAGRIPSQQKSSSGIERLSWSRGTAHPPRTGSSLSSLHALANISQLHSLLTSKIQNFRGGSNLARLLLKGKGSLASWAVKALPAAGAGSSRPSPGKIGRAHV